MLLSWDIKRFIGGSLDRARPLNAFYCILADRTETTDTQWHTVVSPSVTLCMVALRVGVEG